MTRRSIQPFDEALGQCACFLRAADRVLIAAGSGLSVDAGIDYTDPEYFARRWPAMVKLGFRRQYDTIGYQGWSEALQWGFLADHVNEVRFLTPPQPVYQKLRALVADRDYFVITTNVDGQFAKSGFSQDRLYTPQGNYALYQCLTPCSRETWPFKPVIDRILPTIDRDTQEITDPSVIPHCPRCGGPVMMNVRGGDWFIEEPYLEQRRRFTKWVNGSVAGSLLILEFGSGFNTPGVIRWPMEQIAYQHSGACLVRVNRDYPQMPAALGEKGIPIQARSIEVIDGLTLRNTSIPDCV